MGTAPGARRADGRAWDQPRATVIQAGYQAFAEGSALIEMGQTKVLCAASLEERVPSFLKGVGEGWVTAEYSMLPRSTNTRTPREERARGRSQEIQRLIGRCMRAVTDRRALGERTVTLDCDVLQADGGTRTAAITGAYVALHQALLVLVRAGVLPRVPLKGAVAALSVGMVDGSPLVDLCYEEDVRAELDFNLAMTDGGEVVEVQGGTEAGPFSPDTVSRFIELAGDGMQHLFAAQRKAIDSMRDSA